MFKGRSITLKHLLIDGKKQIGLQFKSDRVIHALLQNLSDVDWYDEFGMYYIPNNQANLKTIFTVFRGEVWINGNYFFASRNELNEERPKTVDWYRERPLKAGIKRCPDAYLDKLELKKYADNTVKTYVHQFECFINHYKSIDPENITENEINEYLKVLIRNNRSTSYINQSLNSIKFYYEVVMGMPNRFYSIDRLQKQQQLPRVFSKQEVKALIGCNNNIKHKCFVSLLYSARLRRIELLNLILEDIASTRMLISVKGAKQS